MKRLIAILAALQICLSPFCVVLAMETKEIIVDPPCFSMEEKPDLATSHVEKHFVCCEAKTSEQPSTTQTATSTDLLPSFLHASTWSRSVETLLIPARIRTEKCNHPPDDFERISQSKRE